MSLIGHASQTSYTSASNPNITFSLWFLLAVIMAFCFIKYGQGELPPEMCRIEESAIIVIQYTPIFLF